MRIVAVSDTHSMHRAIDVPDGDVLIHAGDLTMNGKPRDIFDAFAWLSGQPHARIVVTPGNHDLGFQEIRHLKATLKSKFPRIDTLIDQETTIAGLRVYGSPWQPWFNNWAYNFDRGDFGLKQAEERWARIPDDTNILITHGPVYGILDLTLRREHVGCSALKARIEKLPDLRLYVSGHVHEAYGTESVGGVLYVNACSCNAEYRPLQPPIVVDLDDDHAVVVT
jgi:Icc-related predicted phosphoesterase